MKKTIIICLGLVSLLPSLIFAQDYYKFEEILHTQDPEYNLKLQNLKNNCWNNLTYQTSFRSSYLDQTDVISSELFVQELSTYLADLRSKIRALHENKDLATLTKLEKVFLNYIDKINKLEKTLILASCKANSQNLWVEIEQLQTSTSPIASDAGLQIGDIITTIDGKFITAYNIQQSIASISWSVNLQYLRNNQLSTTTINCPTNNCNLWILFSNTFDLENTALYPNLEKSLDLYYISKDIKKKIYLLEFFKHELWLAIEHRIELIGY